jgi:hypothetical protein
VGEEREKASNVILLHVRHVDNKRFSFVVPFWARVEFPKRAEKNEQNYMLQKFSWGIKRQY